MRALGPKPHGLPSDLRVPQRLDARAEQPGLTSSPLLRRHDFTQRAHATCSHTREQYVKPTSEGITQG